MTDISRRTLLTTCAVSALGAAVAAAAPQAPVRRAGEPAQKDVVYGKAGDVPLRLDVYRPTGKSNGMATIHIHGGGFVGGSKETLTERVAPFAALGVPHAFDTNPDVAQAAAADVDFFFDRKVLHPRTYPPFSPGR